MVLAGLFYAAVRGDGAAAQAALAGLERLRTSEAAQMLGALAVADAHVALAQGRPVDVLRHGREAMSFRDSLGIGSDAVRLTWPPATRAALQLGDHAAVDELLALLEGELPGRLPPVLRAERELVRARLALARGEDAGAELDAAIATMRTASPPHLLAYGLLDLAAYLARAAVTKPARPLAVAEAREIGERLGCRPVLDLADRLIPQASPVPSPR